MKIFAIDTGQTTGLAMYNDEAGQTLQERVWCGMLPRVDAEDFIDEKVALCDLVITEQLTISMATAKKGRQVQGAIEMVGVVRFLCRKHGVELYDKSKPNEVMRFMTDARLKKLGLYVKGPDHPRDATRHLVTWLMDKQVVDPGILLR